MGGGSHGVVILSTRTNSNGCASSPADILKIGKKTSIPEEEKGTKRFKSDNKSRKNPFKSLSEASGEAKEEPRVEIWIHTQEHSFVLMIHVESP